jgi:serine protease Do
MKNPSWQATVFLLALFLGACGVNDENNRSTARRDSPLPWASALPASEPKQPSASAGSSQQSEQIVPLPDFTPLIKTNGPAVVSVITTSAQQRAQRGGRPSADDDPMLEFFRRFMPNAAPDQRQGGGLGSGFIISKEGHILTNAHVVADASDVTVRLADAKREFKAKVIGIDRRTDVALIKVEASDLPTTRLGDSKLVEPGQWVAAIGAPFGFANTITAGIVSATGRSLPDETFVPFIQTDVAVNPGNSGGPLINLKGEVIGINSMIYSRTGGYMGVSFAIPIEVALDVAKQLQQSGKVTRGRLGVGIQPVTKELAQSFRLDSATGAVVTNVEPGSPADKAGLKPGDVILSYNGKKIENPNDLPRFVAGTKPGEKAELEIWRNGKREQVAAAVGEFPSEQRAEAPGTPSAPASNELGLAVRELPPEGRKALGVDYGLVVEDVTGGPAARSPIQPGDVIIGVNQDRFRSLEEFNKLISQRRKGESVALLVRRGDANLYVPVPVG